MKMNLETAKRSYVDILSGLCPSDRPLFIKFVTSTSLNPDQVSAVEDNTDDPMRKIKVDLQKMLPPNATLPSESITFPTQGEHAGSGEHDTVHVDAFLYDDDAIDDLCDAGVLTRNYCKDCGSKNTAPLNFITHSMSDKELKLAFRYALPNLYAKTVVDVGSRLGAVLYGAFFYSSASRIFGVEMNSEWCSIQNRIVGSYQMDDRVQIICDDICNQSQLLGMADVIVMHNVFEFFVDVATQTSIWNHLRKTITRSGVALVLSPSLDESLSNLKVDFDPSDWLVEEDISEQRRNAILKMNLEPDDDGMNSLHFYTVK